MTAHQITTRDLPEIRARLALWPAAPGPTGGSTTWAAHLVEGQAGVSALPLPRTGKGHIQHVLTAIAVNIERLSGLPPAEETSTSRRSTAFQHHLDQREIPRPKSWRTLGT
ncbi:hypothetical protein [Streptomyces sp. MJP52]|uniref:hypothetical protein n=1 Tax=Streptomyces sp. MJP52 TaxID=2940555 RepID=UPI002474D28C|nr:hypothetical protein [Streptomyces sp. MJP52]